MAMFTYSPSKWVPFRDMEAIDRVRRIRREDIDKHPNPDLRIRVVEDAMVDFLWVSDMFYRIKRAADAGERCVLIMPNPAQSYRKVAHLINTFRVDCRRLHTFNMDEYADEHGHIAPESYPQGFARAFKKYFWSQIAMVLKE